MSMAESDIEKLQAFGKKVQSNSTKQKPFLKRESMIVRKDEIKRMLIMATHHFFRLCKLLTNNVYSRIHKNFLSFFRSLSMKKNIFFPLGRKDDLNDFLSYEHKESRVIVEYQKQFMNTSIIIRQRKKGSVVSSNESLIPTPPSHAIAYYFHRLDSQESEQKTKFSPKPSLWDFDFHSQKPFIIKLKYFFRGK